jgi:hypothetical protein
MDLGTGRGNIVEEPRRVRYAVILNIPQLLSLYVINKFISKIVQDSIKCSTQRHYFFFLPATPPANRPRLLRLDSCLCPAAPAGTGGILDALAAELGRRFGFLGGTSGALFSFSWIGEIPISSPPKLDIRCDRLALSCIILNLSSSSVHLTPLSSLGFNRFGRSKLDTGGPCWLLGGPVSELFCLKWLKLDWGTYVRGAMCR